jgi:hypothetical protein
MLRPREFFSASYSADDSVKAPVHKQLFIEEEDINCNRELGNSVAADLTFSSDAFAQRSVIP